MEMSIVDELKKFLAKFEFECENPSNRDYNVSIVLEKQEGEIAPFSRVRYEDAWVFARLLVSNVIDGEWKFDSFRMDVDGDAEDQSIVITATVHVEV